MAQTFLNRCLNMMQALLPHACLLCGDVGGRTPICGPCEAGQPRLPPECCPVCALPVPGAVTCGACLTRAPAFDRITAAYVYAFPVDALVHAFKYGGNLAIAGALGEALARAVGDQRPDCLVPMPLSRARLRERGFNQALEIARSVSARTGIPIVPDACRKALETQPQAALPWKARARNVRGAFRCDAGLEGVRVAVIDDVMTTGATLNELAKCLKRAGAAEVRGWVAARALRETAPSLGVEG
jgi:ComF family protein